jgi:hypothetical protein
MLRHTAFRPVAHAIVSGLFGLLSACSAATPPNAVAGGAPPPQVAGEAPTAKPAAKMSPAMVGTVSPVGIFLGQGRDWRIEIRALDPRQHQVSLQWTALGRTDSGTAVYDGPLDIPRNRPLALEGRLQTPQGTKPLRIEIRSEACTDHQGVARPQRIALVLDGRTALNGCGDLAMF